MRVLHPSALRTHACDTVDGSEILWHIPSIEIQTTNLKWWRISSILRKYDAANLSYETDSPNSFSTLLVKASILLFIKKKQGRGRTLWKQNHFQLQS